MAETTKLTVAQQLKLYQRFIKFYREHDNPKFKAKAEKLLLTHLRQLSKISASPHAVTNVVQDSCPPGTHPEPGIGCVPD